MRSRAHPARVRPLRLAVTTAVTALLVCGLAAAPAQATSAAPLVSADSTSSDSWVTLPMGDLSNPNNTFWELFHASPGSSRWSLVTPPGAADNGGLVESASAGAALVGVVPSGLLRFSPLAQSADSGSSWLPAFLPGALASVPDALAYESAPSGGAIALLRGGRALTAPVGLSSWSPLITAAALSRVSPACSVDGLDGATLLPSGSPLIATGCRRGGQVALFTRTAATWQSAGLTLAGPLRGAATVVLRMESTVAETTVLALASRNGRRSLVALWRSGSAPWTMATPLALSSGVSLRATAVNPAGDVAVLLGDSGTREAVDVAPSGTWNQLPRPPARTVALALPARALPSSGPDVDAFTVGGASLGVFSLTPSGEAWARVQSSRIPLAYGSSS